MTIFVNSEISYKEKTKKINPCLSCWNKEKSIKCLILKNIILKLIIVFLNKIKKWI
jgi:hypothetical protein